MVNDTLTIKETSEALEMISACAQLGIITYFQLRDGIQMDDFQEIIEEFVNEREAIVDGIKDIEVSIEEIKDLSVQEIMEIIQLGSSEFEEIKEVIQRYKTYNV